MASSPSHQFGQYLGNVIETLLVVPLEGFCRTHALYLDKHGPRPAVRSGKKATWLDKYENKHDLDFVIERDGSADKLGRPLAFIESAWRRYTKHSRNKAQEIQGAVLPIVEKFTWDKPFLGAVLAGVFTEGSLSQLKSHGFHVVYISYDAVVAAYKKVGIDVSFEEDTEDEWFTKTLGKIQKEGTTTQDKVMAALRDTYNKEFVIFFEALEKKLKRHLSKVLIVPLFGKQSAFASATDAIRFVNQYSHDLKGATFQKFEVMVQYSNGDNIDATFSDKGEIEKFLKYAAA